MAVLSVEWEHLTLDTVSVYSHLYCAFRIRQPPVFSVIFRVLYDLCMSTTSIRHAIRCGCAFPLCMMQDGRNALHLAAKGGHVSTIRCLAPKMEALLHSTDHEGYTMLHWAAQEGQTEVVRLALEEYHVDVNAVDKVCV